NHLSPAEQRAFRVADNRLAELAGWDRDTLAIELAGLIELDFSLEVTGVAIGGIEPVLRNEEEEEGGKEPRRLAAGPHVEFADLAPAPVFLTACTCVCRRSSNVTIRMSFLIRHGRCRAALIRAPAAMADQSSANPGTISAGRANRYGKPAYGARPPD